MEQLVKQNQSINSQGFKADTDANGNYRSLITRLIAQLEDANVELIEGGNRTVLGDRDADLRAQIVVHDPSFFRDTLQGGSIGAAEAFIDGKWTSPDLTALVQVMARNQSGLDAIENKMAWLVKAKNLFFRRK